MKIERGRWVSFQTADGHHARGSVTASKGKTVRLVDSRGYRYTTSPGGRGRKIHLKSIRPVSMGVFVLDTQLDKGWRSRRQGARFWEEYCYHADSPSWDFGYERIHSLADLAYVLERRTIREHVLIFNGHGSTTKGWHLSNGDCFWPGAVGMDRLRVNEKNRHKVVLFSACDLGKNAELMKWYRKTLGADAVVAYAGNMMDGICFLVEAALLQLIYSGHSPKDAVRRVRRSFDAWKGTNQKWSRSIPITVW